MPPRSWQRTRRRAPVGPGPQLRDLRDCPNLGLPPGAGLSGSLTGLPQDTLREVIALEVQERNAGFSEAIPTSEADGIALVIPLDHHPLSDVG